MVCLGRFFCDISFGRSWGFGDEWLELLDILYYYFRLFYQQCVVLEKNLILLVLEDSILLGILIKDYLFFYGTNFILIFFYCDQYFIRNFGRFFNYLVLSFLYWL